MFGDNLKEIRKTKGYTQEELAIKLNVVRQTVSKWEKGLSVPDVETLSKIAEILDVDVSTLLGKEIITNPKDENNENNENEIAVQLGKISEQLAIKNRRRRKIWKGIIIILISASLLVAILTSIFIATPRNSETEETIEIETTAEDSE